MDAPEGTLYTYEKRSPLRQLPNAMKTDSQMMRLNWQVNKLAVIWGMVSREIASTMPTMRRHATIVRAISIISPYSIVLTGRCWERANSRSNARQMIGCRNKVNISISIADIAASVHMSEWVMVRIFPKRPQPRPLALPSVLLPSVLRFLQMYVLFFKAPNVFHKNRSTLHTNTLFRPVFSLKTFHFTCWRIVGKQK